jgi:hypothetical protein
MKKIILAAIFFLSACSTELPRDLTDYEQFGSQLNPALGGSIKYDWAGDGFFKTVQRLMTCPIEKSSIIGYDRENITDKISYGSFFTVQCIDRDPSPIDCVLSSSYLLKLECNVDGKKVNYEEITKNST